MEMNFLNNVEINLVFSGKDFGLKEFTKEIGISPSEVRQSKDWPEVIRHNVSLPESLHAHCEWCISEQEAGCKTLEGPIKNLILKIAGKEEKIKELCKKNNVEKSLIIVISGNPMYLPEMVISSELVSYFGELEVEIGFDLYVYDN